MSFPTEPGQIGNAWLTGVLRAHGLPPASSVVGHTWTPVALPGAAGVVGRVQLSYDGDRSDLPASVVIKFANPFPSVRAMMHRFGFYRTEVEFYRHVGADAGIPTPRCYAADLDDGSGAFVLVLEDMSDARVGGGADPSVADVETAVDHLAAFHARWWNSPRLRELAWLPLPGSPGYEARLDGIRQWFGGALPAVRGKLGAQFPAILFDAGQRMVAGWSDYIAARSQATPTLVHRDFHPQQLFFPSERGGRFAVFDWQTVGIGAGADDLARIVAMGLTTAQRAAHDRALIERYHRGVTAHGVTGYPLDRCVAEFRLGLSASLLTNVIGAAAIDFSAVAAREAETGVTLAYALFDRLAAAMEAHDALGPLAS